ncbi:MAG: MFS transporter [Verrucomicrobiota bacterium]
MDREPSTVAGKSRALLRGGPFARYMAGESISMTGTWMQAMAQSWVMTTLTDSAAMLGMVNLCAGLPMIALSMVGGAFADRYDKRNILLLTQVVQILLALLAGWLVATGRIQIWHMLAVAVLLGISTSFEMPAASALVPELVGKSQVATAIAIDRSVFHGTRLIGPALAGYVIGFWGPASAFFANAFSFVALMVALFTISPRAKGSAEEEEQRLGGMKEGFAYIRSDKPSLAMIALMASTTVFVFPVMVVMLPLYVKNVLQLGPDKMGMLMGISGIGSLTGSIGLLGVRRENRRRLMLAAVFGVTLALTGLSTAHRFAAAAGSLVLLSLGVSTLIGLANTVVQERAPGPMRGRVSAIAGLSFFGLMPFAGLGITSVADRLGIRTALLVSATAYLTAAIYILAGPGRKMCDVEPVESAIQTAPLDESAGAKPLADSSSTSPHLVSQAATNSSTK